MKRIFAYIGTCTVLTDIILCLIPSEHCQILIFCTMGLAVLLIAGLLSVKNGQAKAVLLCIASCFFACLIFSSNYFLNVKPVQNLNNKTAYCQFYITSQNSNGSYEVKVTKVNGNDDVDKFNTTVYFEDSNLSFYKEYAGRFEFFINSDDPFNSYGSFADRNYINASCDEIKYIKKDVKSLRKILLNIREDINNRLNDTLGSYYGGFSTALLTGDKSNFDYNIKNIFYSVGASHITAVSGLHLSVITGMVLFLLRKLKVNKKVSSALCILLVLLCMGVADFSGSVTRAGIMMLVMFASSFFNMRSDGANSLGLSAFLISLNPYGFTDMGTVFSTVCVFAVVVVYPLFCAKYQLKYQDPLFKTNKEKFVEIIYKILSLFFTSLIVSLVSLPVSYFFFGSTVLISPLVNIFVMPFGSICVVLSFLCYIISLTHIGFLINCISFLTVGTQTLLINTADFFSSFDNLKITFDYRFGVVLAGAFVLIGIGVLTGRKSSIRLAALLSVFMCIICSVTIGIYDRNSAKIYVADNGAFVMTYNDTTVVSNINNKNDYYKIRNYLQNNCLDIDYLICKSDDKYFSTLSNDVGVSTLICDEFNDTILKDTRKQNLEVHTAYKVKIDDGVFIYFVNGGVTMDIKGFTMSNFDSSCTSYVCDGRITDSVGTVNLKNSPVVYTVDDANTFKVRRINRWQK